MKDDAHALFSLMKGSKTATSADGAELVLPHLTVDAVFDPFKEDTMAQFKDAFRGEDILKNKTILTIFGLTYSLCSSVLLTVSLLIILYVIMRVCHHNKTNRIVLYGREISLSTQLLAFVLTVAPFLILADVLHGLTMAVSAATFSAGIFIVYDSLKESIKEIGNKKG